MRLIHTSDWHLGHRLHGRRRDEEHAAFLGWLLDQCETQSADALIIAGDIFDTANPPASALSLWYDFLAKASERFADLDIVVVGGNHDSAARIDAPKPVLFDHGIHIVGGVPRGPERAIDFDSMICPLTDKDGRVAAWVAAVPFLRPVDLPRVETGPDGDVLIEGVREVYRQSLDLARARRSAEQAVIATGHCFMRDGQVSEESERKILGGNLHALPVSVFDEDVAYVALGHLHRPQRVGGREGVRYCGSPIPLSMKEATYPHQILVVDFDGADLDSVTPVLIPRTVDVMRIPTRGSGDVDTVLSRLRELEVLAPALEPWRRPFLEVAVATEVIDPSLRAQIDDIMADKAAVLVRLHIGGTGGAAESMGPLPARSLAQMQEEEVFTLAWEARFGSAPPPHQIGLFHELIDAVRAEDPET